jgi:hypothetical protein
MGQEDRERKASQSQSSTKIEVEQNIGESKSGKVVGTEFRNTYIYNNYYPFSEVSEASYPKTYESTRKPNPSQSEKIKPRDEAMLALLHWNLLPHPQIIDTWPRNGALNVPRELQTFSIIFSKQMNHSWSLSSDAFLLNKAEVIHEIGSPIFVLKRENWKELLPSRTRITLVINPEDHNPNFMDLEKKPASNNQYISFTTI